GLFLLWFFKGRQGGRQPTQLNLKAESEPFSDKKSFLQSEKPAKPAKRVNFEPDVKKPTSESSSKGEARDVTHTSTTAEDVIKNKHKPVLFIYNGHDWDAHEVLGLPRGSALPEVTKKYQQLLRTSDPAQMDFLEAAYKAILRLF
ncbi:MAG: hypothetical protein V4736_06915, partial [Bdellovibrionota bacterium]